MALRSGYKGFKKLLPGLKIIRPGTLGIDNDVLIPELNKTFFPRSEAKKLTSKNLMINKAVGAEVDGITYVVNSDKTITANNTATADSILTIMSRIDGVPLKGLEKGIEYILSGDNASDDDSYIFINMYVNSTLTDTVNTDGGEVTFSIPENITHLSYGICVKNGKTVNNKVFYPMIRLASDPDDSYSPPAFTNYELTERYNSFFIIGEVTLTNESVAKGTFSISKVISDVPADYAPIALAGYSLSRLEGFVITGITVSAIYNQIVITGYNENAISSNLNGKIYVLMVRKGTYTQP